MLLPWQMNRNVLAFLVQSFAFFSFDPASSGREIAQLVLEGLLGPACICAVKRACTFAYLKRVSCILGACHHHSENCFAPAQAGALQRDPAIAGLRGWLLFHI